ncbi:CPBP family intramembrane glutamic endopeptidase [Luteimicrobium subarcticum]|uniref:CAAX prenyl protease 2/Lysostaphin resistance protein A-like domain-containing protein n=1 Tax=Luteimicrobium subarcticum TaxID=620910 RepID=A0A2M8W6T0_9MICO|nr:CPBP family intramembrane glutamic endopeptidase [Luteimicrobium subarcticum]PJI86604.1 hypothetical protein CLV34_2524 [Luteimicrobium subarcticum]
MTSTASTHPIHPTTPGRPGTRRRGLRVTAMVTGFLVVMLAVNAVAAALDDPVAGLVVGPLLGVLVLALYRVAVRRVEGHEATDLPRTHRRSTLLRGVSGGCTLATVMIGGLALAGGYRITGWGSVGGAVAVVGTMCAVAVTEEVLFRGVVLRLLQERWGTVVALATSAVLFGGIHLLNPGATLAGAVAVAIEAGLMLGAAYVASGNLWLPIGLHLGWNATTVGVFGTIGSGDGPTDGLVRSETPGATWLTGGTFGPEAGVVAVVVCSLVTVLLLVVAHRRGRIVPRPRRA